MKYMINFSSYLSCDYPQDFQSDVFNNISSPISGFCRQLHERPKIEKQYNYKNKLRPVQIHVCRFEVPPHY